MQTPPNFDEEGYEAEPDLTEAARKRLKSHRNAPCPCGSGKKYKKCCMRDDERLVLQATKENDELSSGLDGDASTESGTKPLVRRVASPEEAETEAIWGEWEALQHPTTEEMDGFVARLLMLPPKVTMWADVITRLAEQQHEDLPGVFRRIDGALPRTEGIGLGNFYWAAAEMFYRRGMSHLLPEVAEGMRTLDMESYDADALTHVEDYLLESGFEGETLRLAEHFLPIEREDDELMPYAVPRRCELIFELRAGQAIRDADTLVDSSPEKIAKKLRRDVEDEIDGDIARAFAHKISSQADSAPWTRAGFELVKEAFSEDSLSGRENLRLMGTLVRVIQEAWRLDKEAPGCFYRGLNMALQSAYMWQDERRQKGKKAGDNLLDYLRPAGLEKRIAQSCADFIGLNVPRARLLLRTYELLNRIAKRHDLISAAEAQETEKELLRLRNRIQM